MNTKFPALATCLLLLFCALPLYGQQAEIGSRRLPPQCLGRPIPPRGVITSVCQLPPTTRKEKPALNNLPPNRDRGTYITFDAPGAGTGPYEGTSAYAVSDFGEIVGSYFDASFKAHGFLRTPDGTITSFDVPTPPPRSQPPSMSGERSRDNTLMEPGFTGSCELQMARSLRLIPCQEATRSLVPPPSMILE